MLHPAIATSVLVLSRLLVAGASIVLVATFLRRR